MVKKRAEADEIVDFAKFNIEDLLLDMVSFENFKLIKSGSVSHLIDGYNRDYNL